MIIKNTEEVIVLVHFAGVPGQHKFPFNDAIQAESAIREAIKTGIFSKEINGVKILASVQGAFFIIATKKELESQIMKAKIAQGGIQSVIRQ